MLSTFYIGAVDIVIIAMLNSVSDNSKMCVMFESGSENGIFPSVYMICFDFQYAL